MGYRRLNLSRVGRAILIGISLSLLMSKNTWGQDCTEEYLNAEIQKFVDTNTEEEIAIRNVVKCEDKSIDVLTNTFKNKNEKRKVRLLSIEALGKIGGKEVVEPLREALRYEEEIRCEAVYFLSEIGKDARNSVPDLVSLLSDKSQSLKTRRRVAYALGEIGESKKEVITALIQALGNEPEVSEIAISTLGIIVSNNNYDLLVKELENSKIGWRAAEALGRSGWKVDLAINKLFEVLETGYEQERLSSIGAIKNIADSLKLKVNQLSRENIKQAIEAMNKAKKKIEKLKSELSNDIRDQEIDEVTKALKGSINSLEQKKLSPLFDWLSKNSWIFLIPGFYFSVLSIYGILLWKFPLKLLYINELLKDYGEIPVSFLSTNLPLRRVMLGGLFHYHPRVLDAWIEAHIKSAREEFLNSDTVQEREIYISIGVEISDSADKQHPQLEVEHLQPKFAKPQTRLLIYGEGGAGKTSLACEIAKWGMEDDPDKRLAQQRMLPIFIKEDLRQGDTFIDKIHGKLQDLSNIVTRTISKDLLDNLLRNQRLLVIVDGFSEMSKATQELIRPDNKDFPVFALIVTSRTEKTLDQVDKTKIKPLSLSGSNLMNFMEKYLVKQGHKDLSEDPELSYASGDLLKLLSETKPQNRSVTVLFAKLYADVLITNKNGNILSDMPKNIPELILSYLNKLNLAITEDKKLDNTIIHKDLKAIAWKCLEQNYQPTSAKIKDVESIIDGKNPEEKKERLKYFENSLHLIKTSEFDNTPKIYFDLEPLAEYLAALYLIDSYEDQEYLWKNFLKKAQDIMDSPESIKGFLLSVKDCCLVYGKEVNIPHFVVGNIQEILGVD